jgi:hypothetical protein
MKKLAGLMIAACGLLSLSACIAVPVPADDRGYEHRDRRGGPDRDHDGRYERDRDGDGVPDRRDRQPDNPRRY